MPAITKFRDNLYLYPKDRIIAWEEHREQFLTSWGFTFYGTYYGHGSDEGGLSC
jgi:hypothetical protein